MPMGGFSLGEGRDMGKLLARVKTSKKRSMGNRRLEGKEGKGGKEFLWRCFAWCVSEYVTNQRLTLAMPEMGLVRFGLARETV